MQYLPTAFANLAFAWKLYNYGLEGKIDIEELDIPITFKEGGMIWVLPDKIFSTQDDFILALENNLGIAFGAAAITLNRSREEAGIGLPRHDDLSSENHQCIVVIYQIRNAFAHDIAEPKWEIRNPNNRRIYQFGGLKFDLSNVSGQAFKYEDIGGPDALVHIKEFAETNLWNC